MGKAECYFAMQIPNSRKQMDCVKAKKKKDKSHVLILFALFVSYEICVFV